jgi:hypothetical protein
MAVDRLVKEGDLEAVGEGQVRWVALHEELKPRLGRADKRVSPEGM